MEDLILAQLRNVLANDVFTGIAGGSLFASSLYLLRKIPTQLWEFLQWRFTCSILILSEDAAYERVCEWLAAMDYAKACRRVRISSRFDEAKQEQVEYLSPGLGAHTFLYKGRPMRVERTLPDKGGIGGWKRFEDIKITMLGTNAKILRELLVEIGAEQRRSELPTINVYLYRHRWSLACRKPKRDFTTLALPASTRSSLVEDVASFLSNRGWYSELGIPYRRGYLLEGPPGCGKTSLVIAVASMLSRPLYVLNLGSVRNDDELIDAVCEVPDHGILLIEDIDAAKATAKRSSEPAKPADPGPAKNGVPPSPAPKDDKPQQEISLSALLNVLDGAFAKEGRLMFMTTNHPEAIDPALLRPGRADRRIVIGPLESSDALSMCERFLPRGDAARVHASLSLPISGAVLQEQLVSVAVLQRSLPLPAALQVTATLPDCDPCCAH